ncbi:MAG: T9SS type A sorting domain-containing protein [Bacteroidales bacterium]|jgi:hypothetical protein|nr:T9SS type A sorting domain-containing protein [Bacteroidales bacterium]
MKKLLIISLLAFVMQGVYAQSAQIWTLDEDEISPKTALANGDTIDILYQIGVGHELKLGIKNADTVVHKYIVFKEKLQVDPTTEVSFCFGITCYGASTVWSPDTHAIEAGNMMPDTNGKYFSIDFFSSVDEIALVRYSIYNAEDMDDKAVFYARYSAQLSTPTYAQLSKCNIYPNPANGNGLVYLQLEQTEQQPAMLSIYDVLGKCVSVQPVNESITLVNLPSVAAEYFFVLQWADKSKKVIKVSSL